jgi:hypothetical protein
MSCIKSNDNRYNLFQLSSQLVNAKKIATRAIETYPLEWIVIHETLQNSLDAIQKSDKESGTIRIVLDIDQERVDIWDNGKGFPHDIALLGLGGTDKDDDPESNKLGGNLGVGLKVVILSSKTFETHSIVNNQKWGIRINDGYRFRESDVIIEVFPEEYYEDENQTSVSYTFPENQVSRFIKLIADRYLNKIHEDLAHDLIDKFKLAVEYHFRVYSYAGNVSRLLGVGGIKPVRISLKIICKSSLQNTLLTDELKALFNQNPEIIVEFENRHWDIEEIIRRLPRRVRKPFLVINPQIPEAGRFQRYPTDHILIKKFSTKEDFKALFQNPFLKQPIDIRRYDSFFDQVEGIYLIVGSVDLVEKYLIERQRQFIAASGIPSSHLLRIPVGIGELGYAANIHMIINVKQKLNLGKQTISNPWLIGMCNDFFSDAFKATLRHIARAFVGEEQITTPGEQIEQVSSPPMSIVSRPDLGIPSISIAKVPETEIEVIALFYELIGRGYLKGYRTYNLSHVKVYDGKGMMKLVSMSEIPNPNSDRDLQNFEFKLRLSDIIDDFESGKKRPGELALIIVWEDDQPNHPDYQIVDVNQTPDRDRYMDKVDRCIITREGKSIQVLVLKDIIEHMLKDIKNLNTQS